MNKKINKLNSELALISSVLAGFWPTAYNLLRDDKISRSSSYEHPLFMLAMLCFAVGALLFGYYISFHAKESWRLIITVLAGLLFFGAAWVLTGFSIFA